MAVIIEPLKAKQIKPTGLRKFLYKKYINTSNLYINYDLMISAPKRKVQDDDAKQTDHHRHVHLFITIYLSYK